MAESAAAARSASDGPERTVFVTVGTTRFDDLVRAVDSVPMAEALAGQGYTALVIQAGSTLYHPKRLFPPNSRTARLRSGFRVEWFDYAPTLAHRIQQAALVISHAGSGSLFEALGLGKAVIAVPNPILMDDHQRELAEKLAADGHLVAATPETLLQAVRELDHGQLVPYERGRPAGIVQRIDALFGVGGSGNGGRGN